MRGEVVNLLAQAHRILHPDASARPNVMLVDIEIDGRLLPTALYRYLPCLNYDDDRTLRVLGAVSLYDLPDDSELFLDYWDVFVWKTAAIPKWMVMTPAEERWFLSKSGWEEGLAPLHFAAKNAYAPQLIVNRLNAAKLLEEGLSGLLPPHVANQTLNPSASPAQLKGMDSKA